MSDQALNCFLARGTTAQRLAFTPDPPTPAAGPPAHAVLWYDTDLSAYFSWNGATWDAAAVANSTITNAKLADMAADTIKGRANGAGTGVPQDLTSNQLSTILDTATDPLTRKTYVDALAVNLGKRARVRAATTANITIATALNNADVLDGVTLATGDQVLVKNQSAPEENGIYVVAVSPARAAEFDTYDEHPGSLTAVEEGTANADTLWLCTSNEGGTINVTAIAFSQLVVTAGAPSDADYLVKTANGGLSAERVVTDTATITWDFATSGQAKANQADMAQARIKLRASGAGTGAPIDGTADQASTILDGATDPLLRSSVGALIDEGNSGTALTVNLLSKYWGRHKITLTGNVTFTITNPVTGGCYVFLLYTGAGSFTAAWPGTVKWPAGTAPVITATASRLDLVTLIWDGTDYFGSFNQNYTP